jgi:hypothetical protein
MRRAIFTIANRGQLRPSDADQRTPTIRLRPQRTAAAQCNYHGRYCPSSAQENDERGAAEGGKRADEAVLGCEAEQDDDEVPSVSPVLNLDVERRLPR